MEYITEAVFANGKKKMKPIEDQFQICKDELIDEIRSSGNKFDPDYYWRQSCWKDLEDQIQKQFGFRSVYVVPYDERYDRKTNRFETRDLFVVVNYHRRYPIEGLVTQNGFYDKSHSIAFTVTISLGAIRDFSASELTAALLHEFGHVIDPAIMDIHYTETNVLAKYMTDRESSITDEERKAVRGKKHLGTVASIMVGCGLTGLYAALLIAARKLGEKICSRFGKRINEKQRKNPDRDKTIRENIKKIEEKLKHDVELNRRTNGEAYADDFARMYGYGPQLGTLLMKMKKNESREIKSRSELERDRQMAITQIFLATLDDTHKTDVHRIKALIKSYYKDINDPNTPNTVKKQLQDDVGELEIVLDEYLNHFDKLTNRINKMIADEIDVQDFVKHDTEMGEDEIEYLKSQQAENQDPNKKPSWAKPKNVQQNAFDSLTEFTSIDKESPFFEKAKHPVKQSLNRFKQRYHYQEKEVQINGETYFAGVITVDGIEFVMAGDNKNPITLNNIDQIGDKGSYMSEPEISGMPMIHISAETFRRGIDKETHAVLMHEVRHYQQSLLDLNPFGKLATAKAKDAGVDFTKVHDVGSLEIDSDLYATQKSEDKDAIIKHLRRLYRDDVKHHSIKKLYGREGLTLSKDDQTKIERYLDYVYDEKLKISANHDDATYQKLRKQPKDLNNEILMAAATEVARIFGNSFGIELDAATVLWNTTKYRSLAYRVYKYAQSPNPRAGNDDFKARKKAIELAKETGKNNPFETKPGETLSLDKVIEYFHNDIIHGYSRSFRQRTIEQMRDLLKDDLNKSVPASIVNQLDRLALNRSGIILDLSNLGKEIIQLNDLNRDLRRFQNELSTATDPEDKEVLNSQIEFCKKDQQYAQQKIDQLLQSIRAVLV